MRRRLSLRKETLTELTNDQLHAVAGGYLDTVGDLSLFTCTCGCASNGCCSDNCSNGGVCCNTYTCPTAQALTPILGTFGL